MNKKRKRILALVLAELFLLALIGGALFYFAGGHQASRKEDQQTAQTEEAEETPVTLLFASDFQKEDGWDDPAVTLGHVIDAAQADGKTIDKVIICGDYSNVDKRYDYQISPEEGIGEIKDVVSNKIPSAGEDDMLFVQGNHDSLTSSISESGLHEYDDHLVYVLNTQGDYPWRQGMTAGSLDKVKRSSQELKECLDGLVEKGETRPLIIAGHVPLHFTARTSSHHSTGDNLYSYLMFDVVNDAAKSLDIIYLFGHDHSKGWDCYLGGSCVFRAVGDEILIPRFSENDVTTDEFSE